MSMYKSFCFVVSLMLCCVGLFAGLFIGQYLGGPWTFVAPILGFGLGLVGDRKFMHKYHAH